MCEVLKVSRSGYYAWRTRPASEREMANQEILREIRTVHRESDQTYGSPRIYQALLALGWRCSRGRVARLMKASHIQANERRRQRSTTRRNETHRVTPNLLKGDFAAEQPDQKWLVDTLALHASACVSYIPTGEGWLYLAAVLDLYSRRIVGWAMAERMTSDLPIYGLMMALRQRRPPSGLIHHSDRGSQYTDRRYRALLETNGIQVSMNGVGSWYRAPRWKASLPP